MATFVDDDVSVAYVVEVELTPKTRQRYVQIFKALEYRVEDNEVSGVVYLCTPDSARAVRAALSDPVVGPRVGEYVTVVDVYDRMGSWDEETVPGWMTNLRAPAGSPKAGEPSTATPETSSSSSLWLRNGGQSVD